MVTTRIGKNLLYPALAVVLGFGAMTAAWAQTPTPTPSGEFLCSAGPRDGLACNSDLDCAPDGVCVIAQGVCNGGSDDGVPCGCAAGTCTESTPACDPTYTGVCVGGPSDTFCCDPTSNCSDGAAACIGSQKICVGGSSVGYSCLNDGQCPGSQCLSTGQYCNGGDYNGYTCVDNATCTDATSAGVCTAALLPTATDTPVVVRTATRTPTPRAGTVLPTAIHTATQTPPNGTVPPRDTPTPISNVAELSRAIGPADLTIPLSDASQLPAAGTVQIDNEQISYLGKLHNMLTGVSRGVGGSSPASHARGASVVLVATAPTPLATSTGTPGNVVTQYNAIGKGCALAGASANIGGGWLGIAGFVYAVVRRRHKR